MPDRTPADAQREATELRETGAGQLSFGLSAVDGDLGKTISEALTNADMLAAVAANKAHEAMTNDLIPEAGRARLRREALEEGRTAITNARDQALAALTVGRKKALVACAPTEPTDAGTATMVRDAVRMELDGQPDALDAAFQILLSDDREAAGVVYGSWGRRWLKSKGVTLDERTIDALDAAMVTGAEKHGTDDQKKAAARLSKAGDLNKLKAGIGVTLGAASHRLEG